MLKRSRSLIFILYLLINFVHTHAQSLLDRQISVHAKDEKLANVLATISRNGDFYFSYNGRLIPKDSLISIDASNQPVQKIMEMIFQNRFELEERDHYIIITAALPNLTLLNPDMTNDGNSYSVSGIIADERTGERLMNASVYDKSLLLATLTDEHGYFRLKFKSNQDSRVMLTISKLNYKTATVNMLSTVKVSSRAHATNYRQSAYGENLVERTGLGGLLISTRQKIQSLNIPDFFAHRPFQVSVSPGLSTHGMFSSQVVNHLSLNIAGGYTAGTDGLELGGAFNINKGNARYLQIAGAFNLVGGNTTGLQLAGASNLTLDTLRGVQLSVYSNKANAQVSGLQLSGLRNETRHLKGVQIGLINVADTSEGASIGLLNITRNGFYRVSYSANNLAATNITLKTGTHAFYSAVLTSINLSPEQKFYAFGLGLGHDFMFGKSVYVSAEADYQLANNAAQWDNQWLQGKLLLNLQVTPHLSIFGGTTYNYYTYNGLWHVPGYRNITNAPDYPAMLPHSQTRNWWGWEAGIAFNGVFKQVKKVTSPSANWYLDVALTGGKGWDEPYHFVSGGEIALQRELGGGLSGILSTGYTHMAADRDVQAPDFIPLKSGIRLKTGSAFYMEGQLGLAFGPQQPRLADPAHSSTALIYTPYRKFMYSASAGFSFHNGLETGLKFKDYGLSTQYKQFALRLGYRIKLGK